MPNVFDEVFAEETKPAKNVFDEVFAEEAKPIAVARSGEAQEFPKPLSTPESQAQYTQGFDKWFSDNAKPLIDPAQELAYGDIDPVRVPKLVSGGTGTEGSAPLPVQTPRDDEDPNKGRMADLGNRFVRGGARTLGSQGAGVNAILSDFIQPEGNPFIETPEEERAKLRAGYKKEADELFGARQSKANVLLRDMRRNAAPGEKIPDANELIPEMTPREKELLTNIRLIDDAGQTNKTSYYFRDEFAKELDANAGDYRGWQEGVNKRWKVNPKYNDAILSAVAENLPQIPISVVQGLTTGGLGLAIGNVAQFYEDGRSAALEKIEGRRAKGETISDKDAEEMIENAAWKNVPGAALDTVSDLLFAGMGSAAAKVGKTGLRETSKKIAKDMFLKAIPSETATELAQQVVTNAAVKSSGANPNQSLTEGLAETAMVTPFVALAGGGMVQAGGSITGRALEGVDRIIEKRKQAQARLVEANMPLTAQALESTVGMAERLVADLEQQNQQLAGQQAATPQPAPSVAEELSKAGEPALTDEQDNQTPIVQQQEIRPELPEGGQVPVQEEAAPPTQEGDAQSRDAVTLDNPNQQSDGIPDAAANTGTDSGGSGETSANSPERWANDTAGASGTVRQSRPGASEYSAQFEGLVDSVQRSGGFYENPILSTPPKASGQEHDVWESEDPTRVLKATHPNQFGLAFGKEGSANPVDYFRRMALANRYLGDDIRVDGVANQDGKLRVVTSQPVVRGREATPDEATAKMEQLGFTPLQMDGKQVWYHPDGILAFDGHERNFTVTTDGNVVPIDVNLVELSPEQKAAIEAEIAKVPGEPTVEAKAEPVVERRPTAIAEGSEIGDVKAGDYFTDVAGNTYKATGVKFGVVSAFPIGLDGKPDKNRPAIFAADAAALKGNSRLRADAVTKTATPEKGGNTSYTMDVGDGGFSENPIISTIMEMGGLMSPSAARAKFGEEWWARNKGEYEDAPDKLFHPTHNKIYGNGRKATTVTDAEGNQVKQKNKGGGTRTPDQMAQYLVDAGIFPEGATPADLWAAVWSASKAAKHTMDSAVIENNRVTEQVKQARSFERAASKKDGDDQIINSSDLSVGDVVTVDGEELRVTDVDPDTGAVTLQDGSKFGKQVLEDGKLFYGEVMEREDQGDADDPFSLDEPEPAKSGPLPKLRAGENQGDLLATQTEDLTLAGESAVDGDRVAREKAQAEKDAEEAKENEKRNQRQLFGETENPPGTSMGPGAAAALEFPEQASTSTKNEVMEAERKARGASPILDEARVGNEETLDKAEATVAENPNAAKAIVERLLNGEERTISLDDEAVLLVEKVRLMNERKMQQERAMDENASPEEREVARKEWEALELEIERMDQATKASGAIWGRFGQFRQRLLRDDYTFEAMEGRYRMEKGEALTLEESQRIKELSDKIAELQKQNDELAAMQAVKERETAADDAFEQAKKDAKAEAAVTGINPRVIEIAEKIVKRLTLKADAARARIRARLMNASTGLDPTVLADVVIIGTEKLAKAGLDFVKWSSEVLKDFSGMEDAIQPYLQPAWEETNKNFEKNVIGAAGGDKKAPAKVKAARQKADQSPEAKIEAILERMQTRIDEGDTIENLGMYVRALATQLVRSGVREREELIDKLYEAVIEFSPDITRDQVMDAFSGYGDYTPFPDDEVKVTVAQLKGEAQQVGKLRDMTRNKIAAKKSGRGRVEQSDEYRRLTKQVEEAKRRGGFKVTDPEKQARTAAAAVEARLRNEISDIDWAIANRKPIVDKKGNVITNEVIEQLRKERDAKKAILDEMFPKPPLSEDVLKARIEKHLDREISKLEADLKAGKLYSETTGNRLTSAEIEAKRARLEALRDEREVMRSLDTARVEAEKMKALEAELARLQQEEILGFPAGEKKTGPPTADTPEVAALKQQIRELQKKRDEARNPKKDPEKVRIEQLEKAIAEVKAKLAAGDTSVKTGKPTVKTAQVTALEAELATYRKEMAALRNAQRPRKSQEERDIAQLDKRIAELEKKVAAKDISTRQKKPTADSPEKAARKERMAELNRQLTELRLNDADRALTALKARMSKQLMEVTARTARGDFASKPKKVRGVKLDAEATAVKYKLEKAKQEFIEQKAAWLRSQRTVGQRAKDSAMEVLHTARAIKTAFDLSAVFRQGGFILFGNPIRAARALPAMFRAMLSEKQQFAINEEIRNRPNADLYKQAKLFLHDERASTLTKQEEAYMGRFATKIPGVGLSERAYSTFLNRLRADSFDAMVASLGKGGTVTPDEAKVIANFINVATGRGNLGSFDNAAVALNAAFFAPRFVVSRFQLLVGQPLWNGNTRTRLLIAKEYAKTLTGLALFYGLAAALRDEREPIETDPRSSKFMKIPIGKSTIDPMMGLVQAAVVLPKIFSGKVKKGDKLVPIRGEKIPYGGDTTDDVLGRFQLTKLNPALGTALSLARGKNLGGEKVESVRDVFRELAYPISFGDIRDAMKYNGVPEGVALSMLALFGMGIYTKKPKEDN